MKARIFLLCVMALSLAAAGTAQTKISSAVRCKTAAQHALDVQDRPKHSFMVSQSKCIYTKPVELSGLQSKEGADTACSEMTGNNARFRGYYVETFSNGDKAHYRYQGTGNVKEGAFQNGLVKWELFGGTGKLKGIQGKGSCNGKAGPEASVDWECEGEYELPK